MSFRETLNDKFHTSALNGAHGATSKHVRVEVEAEAKVPWVARTMFKKTTVYETL